MNSDLNAVSVNFVSKKLFETIKNFVISELNSFEKSPNFESFHWFRNFLFVFQKVLDFFANLFFMEQDFLAVLECRHNDAVDGWIFGRSAIRWNAAAKQR